MKVIGILFLILFLIVSITGLCLLYIVAYNLKQVASTHVKIYNDYKKNR